MRTSWAACCSITQHSIQHSIIARDQARASACKSCCACCGWHWLSTAALLWPIQTPDRDPQLHCSRRAVSACLLIARLCRRSVLALAVGCVFRSKGGMALQAMLPASVDMLTAWARAAPEASRQPFLHSLWLIATSAGLAFVPHVRVSHVPALQLTASYKAQAVPDHIYRSCCDSAPACPTPAADHTGCSLWCWVALGSCAQGLTQDHACRAHCSLRSRP